MTLLSCPIRLLFGWNKFNAKKKTFLILCMFCSSYCMNLQMYLVFKARRTPIHNHPIMTRLAEYRTVSQLAILFLCRNYCTNSQIACTFYHSQASLPSLKLLYILRDILHFLPLLFIFFTYWLIYFFIYLFIYLFIHF